MKKTLLFLSVITLSIMGTIDSYAQTTYTEDFENAQNITWVNEGAASTQGVTETHACEGHSYRHNAYGTTPSYSVRVLRSPNFQTTGAEVSVSFDYKVVNYGGNTATSAASFVIKLQYSADGGTTWNDQYVINESNHVVANTCATVNTTIADGVIPSGTFLLRFQTTRFIGDFYAYFDNISVTLTEPSCIPPASISSSNVEVTTADISWPASTSTVNGGYQVYYSTENTAPNDTTVLNNTNSVSVDASATTATLSGLTPATTYYAWVKSNCNDTESSTWSSSTSFTTEISCKAPVTVSSSNVTAHTAKVFWTESVSTVSEGYQVYYSTNDTTPDSAGVFNDTNSVSVGASDTMATLSGLEPNTTYYAWVRANCSDTDNSVWSTRTSFVTFCNGQQPNYTQAFEELSNNYSNISIDCWRLAKGGNATEGYTSSGKSYWRGRNFLNNSENTRGAVLNLYTNIRKEWLISPVFDLSAGTSFELTFDYGVTKHTNSDPSTFGPDDYVQLLISVDEGITWTVLETWDANNTPSNEATTYTADITPYISSQTVIAFYGTDGEVDDTNDSMFHIDNFAVTNTNAGTINQELASLNVYPNPAEDVINISNDTQITNIEVYDINGRRLLNQNVGQTSTTIDVSSFASGTYFVKVTAEGKISTKQILVK